MIQYTSVRCFSVLDYTFSVICLPAYNPFCRHCFADLIAPARNFVLILRAEALGRCKLQEITKKLRLHLASAKGLDLF